MHLSTKIGLFYRFMITQCIVENITAKSSEVCVSITVSQSPTIQAAKPEKYNIRINCICDDFKASWSNCSLFYDYVKTLSIAS
jgi:hypothetical protein